MVQHIDLERRVGAGSGMGAYISQAPGLAQ